MSEIPDGPGAALKSARDSMGVSIREIADALNLPGSVVEAMENNDHDNLPPPVFTRGYMRSYARLLELDPDAIVALLPVAGELADVTGEQFTAPKRQNWLKSKPGLVLGAVIVGLVLVAAIVALQTGEDTAAQAGGVADDAAVGVVVDPAPQVEAATEARSASDPAARRYRNPQPSPEPQLLSGDGSAAPAGDTVESEAFSRPSAADTTPGTADALAVAESSTTPGYTAPDSTDPSPDDASAREVASPVSAVPGLDTEGPRRITESGDDVLLFSFDDDCWVEIKDTAGNNLYSDLSRAGRTLELVGQRPFRILLGYAPGVGLEFNGEPVALAPHTRNNVASLVIGQ